MVFANGGVPWRCRLQQDISRFKSKQVFASLPALDDLELTHVQLNETCLLRNSVDPTSMFTVSSFRLGLFVQIIDLDAMPGRDVKRVGGLQCSWIYTVNTGELRVRSWRKGLMRPTHQHFVSFFNPPPKRQERHLNHSSIDLWYVGYTRMYTLLALIHRFSSSK